jgi:hypothetical protein
MLLDDALWAVARLLPPVSAAWLAGVPRSSGPVGPSWPSRYAAERDLAAVPAPEGGLLDLAALRDPGFDPDAVDPRVRAFFERTATHALPLSARWSLPFRLGAAIWSAGWAGRWGQLLLPMGEERLTNEVIRVGDETFWVRRYEGTAHALYVARFDVVRTPDPLVRIVFPVPGGSWVVLLRAVNDGSGVRLTSEGLDLVPWSGSARRLAGLREEIVVGPDRAEHHFAWWGYRFLTLAYPL